MKKLRTGDEVIVISGKDTGKTGTLSKFISETKCIVSGVKIVKKHQKPNPQLNIQGGILEKESPIDVSNLAIYNKKSKKADKINIEINKDKKILIIYKIINKNYYYLLYIHIIHWLPQLIEKLPVQMRVKKQKMHLLKGIYFLEDYINFYLQILEII